MFKRLFNNILQNTALFILFQFFSVYSVVCSENTGLQPSYARSIRASTAVAPILLSICADTVAVTDKNYSNFHGKIVRDRRTNVRKVVHFHLFSHELGRDPCELTESKLKDVKAKFIFSDFIF